jgi:hypothetical protein
MQKQRTKIKGSMDHIATFFSKIRKFLASSNTPVVEKARRVQKQVNSKGMSETDRVLTTISGISLHFFSVLLVSNSSLISVLKDDSTA